MTLNSATHKKHDLLLLEPYHKTTHFQLFYNLLNQPIASSGFVCTTNVWPESKCLSPYTTQQWIWSLNGERYIYTVEDGNKTHLLFFFFFHKPNPCVRSWSFKWSVHAFDEFDDAILSLIYVKSFNNSYISICISTSLGALGSCYYRVCPNRPVPFLMVLKKILQAKSKTNIHKNILI